MGDYLSHKIEAAQRLLLGNSLMDWLVAGIPNLNPLLDLQQAVNFRIIDEFRRLGVEFEYPTQRVILAQQGNRR